MRWLLDRFWIVVLVVCTCTASAQQSENASLSLEEVRSEGNTHEVAVLAGWSDGDLAGWTWGLCHDADVLSVAACDGECASPCLESCGCIVCPPDLMAAGPSGFGPAFHVVAIHPGGVTQAAVTSLVTILPLPPRERFEVLRIRYDLVAESAELQFCDTLGTPPVDLTFTVRADSLETRTPATESLELYNTTAHYFALRAQNVSVPDRTTVGTSFDASLNVANIGTVPSPPSWATALWLSQDTTWDPGDTLLSRDVHEIPLAAGETVEGIGISLETPVVDEGDYYVLASAAGGEYGVSQPLTVDWNVRSSRPTTRLSPMRSPTTGDARTSRSPSTNSPWRTRSALCRSRSSL